MQFVFKKSRTSRKLAHYLTKINVIKKKIIHREKLLVRDFSSYTNILQNSNAYNYHLCYFVETEKMVVVSVLL